MPPKKTTKAIARAEPEPAKPVRRRGSRLGLGGTPAVEPPPLKKDLPYENRRYTMDWQAYYNTPGRRCSATVRVRDDEGNQLYNEDGSEQRRPCRKFPIPGGKVCTSHGGKTPSVVKAARKRLMLATLPVVEELIHLAMDRKVDDAVRVRALTAILDRAGIGTKVEVDHSVAGWERVLNRLAGIENPTDDDVIDGEWEEADGDE